jgi:PAS domain S-box-containing protein
LNWMFPRDKLGNKLILSTIRIFLAFVFMVIVVHLSLNLAIRKLNTNVDHLREIRQLMFAAELGLADEEAGQRSYDLTGNPDFLTAYTHGNTEFDTAESKLDEMSNLYPASQLQQSIRTVIHDGEIWQQNNTINSDYTRKSDKILDIASIQSGQAQFEKFRQDCANVINLVKQEEHHSEGQLLVLTNILSVLIEVLTLLAGAMILVRTIQKFKSIVRPITQLTLAVSEYTSENFDAALPVLQKNNELHILIDGVEKMKNSLKSHFRQLRLEHTSLFENSPEAVFRLDESGSLVSLNSAATSILYYTPDELNGKPFADLIDKKYLKAANCVLRRASLGEPQRDMILPVIRKDGQTIFLNITLVPIVIEEKTVEVYGIANDVTEKRKTEDFMRKADKLKTVGELAAGVAHEIKNPLTVVQGFVQLLQYQSHGRNKEYLDLIFSEVNRMKDIINEFMILAKPQKIQFHTANLQDLLSDVVSLLNAQAILKNISIHLDSQTNDFVNCSPNQLKQVFINLLKNSIEAMSNSGEIIIKVESVLDKIVRIRLIDQGRGIPEEHIRKLGEPFFTTKETGTGLGLMICYRIVEQHHGTMHIESKVGQGTTIDITIPTVDPARTNSLDHA